jgi:hypothetical protein
MKPRPESMVLVEGLLRMLDECVHLAVFGPVRGEDVVEVGEAAHG